MPTDFDTPVSIANDHTRAAMSDDDRNRLAEGALSILSVAGVNVAAAGVKDLVYALANGLRVLGAINVGLADVGLELGALVRATALSGLATAHAAVGNTDDAFPAELITDLAAIAEDDDDDDEGSATDAGGVDAIEQAAALIAQLDTEGRQALAEALVDRTAGEAGLAELLDHFLPDDVAGDDDGDADEGGDRVE